MKVEPGNCQQGIEFVSEVNPREVPPQFIDAIRSGVVDSAPGGIVAGYPIIDVKVTLLKAEYDEENSSDVAYMIAAANAFKEACRNAQPVLKEPIMSTEIVTPGDFTGDIIGDINLKRGKVLSMDAKKNKEVIKVEVPLLEMFGYSTTLRSKSQGRASFTMAFHHYETMAPKLAKEILEKQGIYI